MIKIETEWGYASIDRNSLPYPNGFLTIDKDGDVYNHEMKPIQSEACWRESGMCKLITLNVVPKNGWENSLVDLKNIKKEDNYVKANNGSSMICDEGTVLSANVEGLHSQAVKHPMKIKIKTVDGYDLNLPKYETPSSAGMDVCAYIEPQAFSNPPLKKDVSHPVVIEGGKTALISTGLSVAIPQGFEIQVRPRSGLALKHGITVLNAPGTIDADYRGEIGVVLHNTSDKLFIVEHGMRIAQLVVAPVIQANWDLVDDLDETERGDGGFGSTGQ